MSIRGAKIDHSTLQRWVKRFVFLINKHVRKRKKPVNGSWRMDQTYIKLNGFIFIELSIVKETQFIFFLGRAETQ